MLYFILRRNINFFLDEDMINGSNRFITDGIKITVRG